MLARTAGTLPPASEARVTELRSIKLRSFDPMFATTAMPVAGLMATSLGAEAAVEPTGIWFTIVGAIKALVLL
jgi:hypothetical protein